MRLDDVGVVLLAGGAASRLPGKLEMQTPQGTPLLLAVYRNVEGAGPVIVAGNGSLPPALTDALPCPIVLDRVPGRGPLAALLSALPSLRTRFAFVVAGDAPFVDAAFARFLRGLCDPGVQAVLPVNPAGIPEPLCALYERGALAVAATAELHRSGSPARAAEGLRCKHVHFDDKRVFLNVNTPADRNTVFP